MIRQRDLLKLDAIGAIGTCLTIGGAFASGIVETGMPTSVLVTLSAVAGVYALIGLNALTRRSNAGTALRCLALLNGAFCVRILRTLVL